MGNHASFTFSRHFSISYGSSTELYMYYKRLRQLTKTVILPNDLSRQKQLLNVQIVTYTLSTDYEWCLFAGNMTLCKKKKKKNS